MDLESKALTPITRGEYVIDDIVHVVETERWIYFTATSREADRNPYYRHLYRVRFDGSDLQLLTPEDAHHEIEISPGRRFFVDNYSTVDQPTTSVLRRLEDGKVAMPISKADPEALLSAGWSFPQVFELTVRDGETTVYGAMWKPTNFDPSRKYPVIDNSYTGPHTNVFPRAFSSALNGTNQALAEFGFIVVKNRRARLSRSIQGLPRLVLRTVGRKSGGSRARHPLSGRTV